MEKVGITLAKVLITLGIICILAAMTMPPPKLDIFLQKMSFDVFRATILSWTGKS